MHIRVSRIQKESSVQVFVRDNNVDQALRALKKKMQREGLFREMKLRGRRLGCRSDSGALPVSNL